MVLRPHGGLLKKRKSGDNKEMGPEGRGSGYLSQREPQREEAKSGRIYECVLGRRRKRTCKGTEPGRSMVSPRHRLPLPTNHSPQSTWKVLYWFFYIEMEMALPIQSGPSSISFPTWWADCSLLRSLLAWAPRAESRCSEPVKLETHLYPTPSTGGGGGGG